MPSSCSQSLSIVGIDIRPPDEIYGIYHQPRYGSGASLYIASNKIQKRSWDGEGEAMSCVTLNEVLLSTAGYPSETSPIDRNGEVSDPHARWYAVWTRSRQEKMVAGMLNTHGIRHFLPLKSELRRWSDRMQRVEVPLFSGYLFVHINSLKNSKLQVLKIPGVGALVGNQTGPVPVPDHQIEDVSKVLNAGVQYSIQPTGKEGDRVRVVRGALAGIEGTWLRTHSESRLLISIEMIRQSLSVNILRSDVEVVASHSLPPMRYGESASFRNQL